MTPPEVVELTSLAPPHVRWFTTLEGHNASGSLKDRMVEPELDRMLDELGEALRERGVAELSAGSTARSLAHHCRARRIPFVAFVDAGGASLRPELEALGASVRVLDGDVAEAYRTFERACADEGYVPFRQFDDPGKRAPYRAFGEALRARLPTIHHVVGAVGTGHSLLGVAAAFPEASVHTAEPVGFSTRGVRNLDAVWFGEGDPLFADRPTLGRVLLDERSRFAGETVHTTAGDALLVGDSFRLVLAAALRLADAVASETSFLLVGAENRLKR